MRIAFYMPLKPLGHTNPSGDLVIGSELFDFLKERGHHLTLISRLRARWIYWKPWQILGVPFHLTMISKKLRRSRTDIWLTYHSYYKAPDLLGSLCSQYLKLPYVIFQGIYATKYRRRFKTLPGFWLNRYALLAADLVFTNKSRDYHNLKRIIPLKRLAYVAPGIQPEMFIRCEKARYELREHWKAMEKPVVLSAAMFRPGVKTMGIQQVIKACGDLRRKGLDFILVIAGDGEKRSSLQRLAQKRLPQDHIFLGKIERDQLYRYFSAADLFVFPGFNESLGMVYLEAQACGLPVVAMGQWGAGEVVVPDQTGILIDQNKADNFSDAIARLLYDKNLRQAMGRVARRHVLKNHNLTLNYESVERALSSIIHPF